METNNLNEIIDSLEHSDNFYDNELCRETILIYFSDIEKRTEMSRLHLKGAGVIVIGTGKNMGWERMASLIYGGELNEKKETTKNFGWKIVR